MLAAHTQVSGQARMFYFLVHCLRIQSGYVNRKAYRNNSGRRTESMALWLLKEEPTHYSFVQLHAEGRTIWDGVRNPLARQHLRLMRKGDRAFYYHTGKEKAIVGEVRVVSGPWTVPEADDPKEVLVEVKAVRWLPHPVTLARIKADPLLSNWDLVRLPRLSVMPVSQEQWRRVEELSKQG
jgi:predicted RNA-binding protein with PUA-like domain